MKTLTDSVTLRNHQITGMSKNYQYRPRVIPCTWPDCKQLFKTHGGRNSHITTVHALAAAAAAAQQPAGLPQAEEAPGEAGHEFGAQPPSPPPLDEAQGLPEPEIVVETHPYITGESLATIACFELHSYIRRRSYRRTVHPKR